MTNREPKISFVIPAYNCADTVEESIDSIFNGNIEEGDEVLVMNDCSTDTTKEVLRTMQRKYPSLIVIDNAENKGCPATRNIGIKSAKNPLIFNLDADNVLVPHSVSALKAYLLSEDADMAAFSEYHYFKDAIDAITHIWTYKPGVMTLADFLSGPVNPGPGGNFLYTKASWERIGGYWEYGKGLHEAWGFVLKQLAQGAKFVVLHDSYYLHRHGGDSLFTRESKKKDESSLMATRMIMNYIDLLDDKDARYIRSEEGSKHWFDGFIDKPLHLRSGERGVTGHVIVVGEPKISIRERVRRMVPRSLWLAVKKIVNALRSL